MRRSAPRFLLLTGAALTIAVVRANPFGAFAIERGTVRLFMRLDGLGLDTPTDRKRGEIERAIVERLGREGIVATVSYDRISLVPPTVVVAGEAIYQNGDCVTKADAWWHEGSPGSTSGERLALHTVPPQRTTFLGPYECGDVLEHAILERIGRILTAAGPPKHLGAGPAGSNSAAAADGGTKRP